MTLSQNGLNYICENFGDLTLCCVRTGLSWYYTFEGTDYPETGGTAQIVARHAVSEIMGIESLTMTNPPRGTFTQAELNAANSSPVTLEDAQLIAEHDDTSGDQWCFGDKPPSKIPWAIILTGIGLAAVAGVIVWKVKAP